MSMSRPALPVIFFAFANDRADKTRTLRNLAQEKREVRQVMTSAEQAGLCEVVERSDAMVSEVLDVFQDARYRDRLAIFHFAGHAGSGVLLFESPEGAARLAHAGSFARFLGTQRGLELVFLNGCSTHGQVQDLLAAGVPAVIATSESIPDAVATEISSRFYKALASGAPLRTAFTEAVAAVQTRTGELPQLWDLYVAPGAEEDVQRWSLPKVARDYTFGLPALPTIDLPDSPFKHLAAFTRADAPVFFGRGREIRELFEAVTLPDAAPIVLLFGDTGAGKSSLLAAGLQPRLEAVHKVLYSRRDGVLGLAGTLAQALNGSTWHQQEEAIGKPLTVILDQAEEAWTRPLPRNKEIEDLAAMLRALFALREDRPQGRLILGFRKEWLAEVRRLLEAEKLPRTLVEVTHLDRNGIAEAVAGPASSDRLKRQYFHLEIAPELPGLIADDLVEQSSATIAPILQILLTKMWAQATQESPPRFSVTLYQDMKRRGLLLDDFLEEQLGALRKWRPEVVGCGLVLDLLFFHTTSLGTAETHSAAEVIERYGHRQEVADLFEKCKNLYLLAGTTSVRLAHDTLAPLVRRRFEASDLPGQRAQRILQERAREWTDGKTGTPLDEFDLALVEGGQRGTRARTIDEERLVSASRRQAVRRRRQKRNLQIAAVVAVTILAVALLTWRKWQQALVSEEQSRDRTRTAIAANLVESRPTEAGLVLLEVQQPDSTRTASEALHEMLNSFLETALLQGHTDTVGAVSFSPDGTRAVTASADNTARVWNVATGKLVAILAGHKGSVMAASFSPDGTRVVTASVDGTARIWNATTSQSIATLMGHTDTIPAASFSPDGTRVVTASRDNTARIWNAATGQPIATFTGHRDGVWAAAFSPDGTRVVTASADKTAQIWNAATGQPIATLTGHTDPVSAASFSPDSTRVVTASWDKTARIWNAATGQLIATLTGHADSISTASFSADGIRVVTASDDKTARIWNAATGQSIATLTGHTNRVVTASFSPDGTRVLTGAWDQTARIWNAATGQPIAILAGHTRQVVAASFSPNGTQVVTGAWDKTARIWNTATGQSITTLAEHMSALYAASFSPDGTRVVTASNDRTARIWNTATGHSIAILTGHTEAVSAASFSPDGTRAVTASRDRTARVWNAATGQPIATITGHKDFVSAASFSPDGTGVVTASWDKTARIWSAATGQLIATLTGHRSFVLAASFSPDGTCVVTASEDKTARIWNAATGQLIATLAGHRGPVSAASFSPDGTRVITASQDQTARIWNAATGEPIASLAGHTDSVLAVAFSADGTQVVTASQDETARIWDAATGQLIATLTGHRGPVSAASFSPDGTRVITASSDRTARIWNAATGQPIANLAGHTDFVLAASFSPDGIQVVTASLDNTARIWPATADYAQSLIRGRTPLCLPADFRQGILGEGSQAAQTHEKACKACVPKFSARVKGVPEGDAQTYLAAWREYRRCLDSAR
jgi:WD40 repeat protein